jgi:superfamily II DNA or RNA helicase
MPTGSGKTILAVLAVAATQRPTLIHVPTLDLLAQWERTLTEFFGDGIGVLCGDTKRLGPITVATYDSALNFAERNGNKFGLLVFDECHHLPGEQYRFVGQASIAPFRLGLTATPPEAYRLDILQELTGAIVHEIRIDELKGGTLAPYDVITLSVDLSDEEQKSYDENRKVYREFLVESGVRMASIDGWQQFLRAVARHPNGRAAFKAYRTQKKLAESSPSKEPVLASLLQKHAGERILIFTQDTETAYRIGRNFLLPVITNQTHSEERKEWLQLFRSGDITILVTAKVLNEGVDLPEASVGVVYSGSGTTREHVQRLGRILRASPGKRAIFYELIAANTGERFVNDRRRKHHAYQQT